jgi:hypothetical protein
VIIESKYTEERINKKKDTCTQESYKELLVY